MKIAIVTNSLIISGGTERQAICLCLELNKMGHEATLYTFALNREVCYPHLLKNTEVIVCDADVSSVVRKLFKIPLLGQVFFTLRENSRAKRMAELIPTDTDILNPHEQMAARVVRYARKRGIGARAVVMINDLYLARWSLYDDPAFGLPKKGIIRRLVSWLRDSLENYLFLRHVDNIVVLNDRTRDMVRFYLSRDAHVIRSGIEASEFKFKQRETVSSPVRLLAHGIFFIHRRYEDIIRALALLKSAGISAKLTIIGNYTHKDAARSYRNKLGNLVDTLGLNDNVRFGGVVSDEELHKSYHYHDIFIFASHMQTWGLAVFEAMTAGLPVVLSRSTGAAEVLTDYDNVLLANPLSPESIRDRVMELVRDRELYGQLSRQGADFVKGNLSWRIYASNMLRIFEGE